MMLPTLLGARRRTVERAGLKAGERVLDVCCGSGASAIPAAEAVETGGRVIGVDLAEKLLDLARAKASARRLSNIEFRRGDMLDLRLPEGSFDVVACVFGIFFVPDMSAAVRALWGVVRPGGRLAITTWGPRFFEPASSVLKDAIREVRPDLYKGTNPWDRITEPTSLRVLLREGGIREAEVSAEPGEHPIASPEAWWSAVLGSGYRGTVEKLEPGHREFVRNANFHFVRHTGLRAVEANVVYALARK